MKRALDLCLLVVTAEVLWYGTAILLAVAFRLIWVPSWMVGV
jgi:hypothetical protein